MEGLLQDSCPLLGPPLLCRSVCRSLNVHGIHRNNLPEARPLLTLHEGTVKTSQSQAHDTYVSSITSMLAIGTYHHPSLYPSIPPYQVHILPGISIGLEYTAQPKWQNHNRRGSSSTCFSPYPRKTLKTPRELLQKNVSRWDTLKKTRNIVLILF